MTQLSKIREKLDIIGEKYLDTSVLEKLLAKFAPSYSISQICDTGMISPIKRGKFYINNVNRDIENPYKIADMYFEGVGYMFGGLGVYNVYGYSTQLVEWHTVYNTKISGERIIGRTKFIFKKQRNGFFYGETEQKSGRYIYKIMSRERAFIQMLQEGKVWKKLPENIDVKKLLSLAEAYSTKNIYNSIKKICS
ncbi:MAG: hypothetical protein Q8K26_00840 [Candidatus Gracilibacteria bacterium]|nr:hypothetical protein [Candidatus Gracilibacteria bacterium]